MKYAFAFVFSCLTAAALAGAPPQEVEACKPVKAVVVEEASCSGAKASCSGRRSLAQWRADRIAGRCAARQARSEAMSCSGKAKTVVILCEQGKCD